MFAVNHEDFLSQNQKTQDESLMVRFFLKERKDEDKSLKEGRACFKEVEYVEIRIPGARAAQACRPATWRDKIRFERHYEAFKGRMEEPTEGTPLKEWPQISRSQAEELAFFNVKTVEALAGISDTHLNNFQSGYTLKQRAMEWLREADATKLIAEKEAMENTIKNLSARLEKMEAERAAPEPQPKEQPSTPRRKIKT